MGTNRGPIDSFARGWLTRRHGLRLSMAFFAAVLGLALPLTTVSAGWSQQQEFTANDATSGSSFGVSTALSGDGGTALLGACGVNGVPGFCTGTFGAAYVFTRTGFTWSQQQKLTPNDPASNDAFGRSAALNQDGSTALIGAYNKTVGGHAFAGAAYVFTRSGSSWTQQQGPPPND